MSQSHLTTIKTTQTGIATLRFGIVAGLTAAAVVLPKAMAYATVAGLTGERLLFNARSAIRRFQALQAEGNG